jgi:signal transduction histidine kinase
MTPEPRNDGFGLAGMRERVESLGGSMRVETRPGEGVTLLLTLPLGARAGEH